MNDLHYMPATEALKQFKSRKLSPVELVRAVIDRATAVEPAINAFAQTFFDEALTQAKAAETRYAGNGKPARALEGILVAVKEEAPITGHKNTLGSLPLRDTIAVLMPTSSPFRLTSAPPELPGLMGASV